MGSDYPTRRPTAAITADVKNVVYENPKRVLGLD